MIWFSSGKTGYAVKINETALKSENHPENRIFHFKWKIVFSECF